MFFIKQVIIDILKKNFEDKKYLSLNNLKKNFPKNKSSLNEVQINKLINKYSLEIKNYSNPEKIEILEVTKLTKLKINDIFFIIGNWKISDSTSNLRFQSISENEIENKINELSNLGFKLSKDEIIDKQNEIRRFTSSQKYEASTIVLIEIILRIYIEFTKNSGIIKIILELIEKFKNSLNTIEENINEIENILKSLNEIEDLSQDFKKSYKNQLTYIKQIISLINFSIQHIKTLESLNSLKNLGSLKEFEKDFDDIENILSKEEDIQTLINIVFFKENYQIQKELILHHYIEITEDEIKKELLLCLNNLTSYKNESNNIIQHNNYNLIFIDSVEKYLDCIDIIKTKLEREKQYETLIYYRGQVDSTWPAKANIYRNSIKNEHEMFSEILSRIPYSFRNTNVYENLLTIQHYGGATRLLDITQNPLIALFFACFFDSDLEDKSDGKIFIYQEKQKNIKYYDSDKVQMLANLTRMNTKFLSINSSDKEIISKTDLEFQNYKTYLYTIGKYNKISDYITLRKNWSSLDSSEKQYSHLGDLIHKIGDYKPQFRDIINVDDFYKTYIVKGVMSNDRIERQNGDFIIFGLKNEENGNPLILNKELAPDVNQQTNYEIIIPNEHKKDILKSLETLDIYAATVYPEIDKKIAHIKKKWLK